MDTGTPGRIHHFPIRMDSRATWRYRVVTSVSRVVFRAFLGRRLRIEGIENVPAAGPLLLAANHVTVLDPLLFSFCPGTVHTMAKKEMFRGRALAWIVAGCNGFPIDRGGADRQAMRTALSILSAGNRLVVFGEGQRSPSGELQRVKPGVGFLVGRVGTAVVPCAIAGVDRVLTGRGRLPRRADVLMKFGEPMAGSTFAGKDAQAIADRIGEAIAALLPPPYRGYYGPAPARRAPSTEPPDR